MTEMALMIPGVEKRDARTVAFTFDDPLTAFRDFIASLNV